MSADFDPAIELLTIAEVAEFLKLSVPSVRRLQQGRHVPFHKVGGSVRFAKEDIATFSDQESGGINRLNTLYDSTNV
jgi:excisionase family DNA binding protein